MKALLPHSWLFSYVSNIARHFTYLNVVVVITPQGRCMKADWSWTSPGLDYIELYYKAIKGV